MHSKTNITLYQLNGCVRKIYLNKKLTTNRLWSIMFICCWLCLTVSYCDSCTIISKFSSLFCLSFFACTILFLIFKTGRQTFDLFILTPLLKKSHCQAYILIKTIIIFTLNIFKYLADHVWAVTSQLMIRDRSI